MAILVIARRDQNLKPLKRWRGRGCPILQHGGQTIPRRLQFGQTAPDHRLTQHGCGGLTQRTGLHILRKSGDPALFNPHIHRDCRSAQRRSFARRSLRRSQPPQMRDIRSQGQNLARIQFDKVTVAHAVAFAAVAA